MTTEEEAELRARIETARRRLSTPVEEREDVQREVAIIDRLQIDERQLERGSDEIEDEFQPLDAEEKRRSESPLNLGLPIGIIVGVLAAFVFHVAEVDGTYVFVGAAALGAFLLGHATRPGKPHQ